MILVIFYLFIFIDQYLYKKILESFNPNVVPRAATIEESAKFFVDKWIKNENVKERDSKALFISPKIEEYEEFNDNVTNILANKDEIEIIAADITKKKRF